MRNQTGAFITTCKPTSTTTSPHKQSRRCRRACQNNSPKRPAPTAIMGVLDADITAMMPEERMPTAESTLDLPPIHNQKNKGHNTAPNAPASRGWEKGP